MNGASRSIALMPVSKSSALVDWRENDGGSWCIESRLVSFGRSAIPSIGSPITLNILPSAASPTGTEIGAPVSMTSRSRGKPAVSCMAMVRTRLSPKCCATSSVSVTSPCFTCKAFLIGGSFSSKRTSTTGPIIWVMIPFDMIGLFYRDFGLYSSGLICISTNILVGRKSGSGRSFQSNQDHSCVSPS